MSSLAGYSAFGETRKLEITYHTMTSPTLTESVRIVQLSDLHLGSETTDYSLIAKSVLKLKPDLIVITGDIFDDRDDVKGFYTFFNEIKQAAPIINVLGNWDYGAEMLLSEVMAHFRTIGLITLVNANYTALVKGQKIQVVGLDDLRLGNPRLKKAIEGREASPNLKLLLFHCPGEFHRVAFLRKTYPNEIPNFDLCLAGHTHGGQINFWGFRPILPKGSGGFVHGWYEQEGLKMYVNRGLGCTRIPMRLMAKPEISVFDWRPLASPT